MTVIRSENVLLQDIYVNSTSLVPRKGTNTDGANTMYVKDIIFRRWTVANGDDGISIKANSTRVTVEDSVFHGGAVALGSIGQYFGVYEVIEDIMVRNISYYGGWAPIYGKTWTGRRKGIPPNGGGGGIGHIRNVSKLFTRIGRPDLTPPSGYRYIRIKCGRCLRHQPMRTLELGRNRRRLRYVGVQDSRRPSLQYYRAANIRHSHGPEMLATGAL
jgi:hypothetical protein